MSCRHLNITFKENGDVEYDFFKHYSEYGLCKYIIEYPIDKIEIIGGQYFNSDNFKILPMSNGFTMLEWEKIKDKARGIKYIKKNYLQKLYQYSVHFKY